MLAAVASVSLIVGGIGIMNIMLVSVRERTREIGLRQAIGAKTRDILMQFRVEATTLSICGGIIGILIGIAGSVLISHFAGWQSIVSPGAIMLAVAFSVLVGIGFGFYPAQSCLFRSHRGPSLRKDSLRYPKRRFATLPPRDPLRSDRDVLALARLQENRKGPSCWFNTSSDIVSR